MSMEGEDEDKAENPIEDEEEDDEDEESNYRDPPPGYVRLRPSDFNNIPPTVYFEYPPELGIQRLDKNILQALGNRKLYYTSHWSRICVRNAFHRAGFSPSPSEKGWTAMWSKHQNQQQMAELNCLQKINHFPNSWCVGRKDRLLRTMNTMKRMHGAAFDFHPDGYILPMERGAFLRQARSDVQTNRRRLPGSSTNRSDRQQDEKQGGGRGEGDGDGNDSEGKKGGKSVDTSPLWIMKPVASSCGRGIRVISSLQALCSIPKSRRVILQRYIDSPYLINGNKFDLRIYVLVTGVDPVRVYVHQEGLTRIATSKYSNNNTSNRFAHLTNYSVNKKSKKFVAAAVDEGGETEGFKWSLKAFRGWLSQQESPEVTERVFRDIHDICVKTVIAAEGDITPGLHSSANFRSNCYELFGCDILLTSTLQPILLEVNVSPSLVGSSPLDKRIKGVLLADILHLVGLYPHDNRLLKRYQPSESGPSPANQMSATGTRSGNPFEFACVSKTLHNQSRWRRTPRPENIDVDALGNDESMWLMLLMAEDEMTRSRCTQFLLLHPTPARAQHYVQLYRTHRFSDHLLAKWVLEGGSKGRLRRHIPSAFLEENDKRGGRGRAFSKEPHGTSALASTSACCGGESLVTSDAVEEGDIDGESEGQGGVSDVDLNLNPPPVPLRNPHTVSVPSMKSATSSLSSTMQKSSKDVGNGHGDGSVVGECGTNRISVPTNDEDVLATRSRCIEIPTNQQPVDGSTDVRDDYDPMVFRVFTVSDCRQPPIKPPSSSNAFYSHITLPPSSPPSPSSSKSLSSITTNSTLQIGDVNADGNNNSNGMMSSHALAVIQPATRHSSPTQQQLQFLRSTSLTRDSGREELRTPNGSNKMRPRPTLGPDNTGPQQPFVPPSVSYPTPDMLFKGTAGMGQGGGGGGYATSASSSAASPETSFTMQRLMEHMRSNQRRSPSPSPSTTGRRYNPPTDNEATATQFSRQIADFRSGRTTSIAPTSSSSPSSSSSQPAPTSWEASRRGTQSEGPPSEAEVCLSLAVEPVTLVRTELQQRRRSHLRVGSSRGPTMGLAHEINRSSALVDTRQLRARLQEQSRDSARKPSTYPSPRPVMQTHFDA